ncbi:hypothetical protein ACEWY4_001545 [Coilia grayii]|uniref:Uncharacterized protein n=1 Tax=Coilia grayii TaxID=363190 RepID=A0ABD1KTB4_9TELE
MPKKYSEQVIKQALLAVEEGGSLRRVAAQFGVPHTTLRDWRRGKYSHLPHPNRALLPNEEEALVSYIFWMAAHGFPITQSVALVLAIQVCKASGRENPFVKMDKGLSRMWWSRFRARHPTVASRRPNYIEAERVHGATVARVDELFHICQALYDHHGFRGTPELIYNCDETGFGDKGSSRKRVLCSKGQRTVYAQQVTTREHVTVHCCASAAGEVIPPFVIFEKCLPSTAYSLEGPRNALYGVSDTGYMDSDLFLKWLEHFVRYARQERPLLLFMDQHEAHVGTGVVDFCRANQIEVVCLPSHTTHVLQPLDVSVYGPLKAAFTDMARCLGLVRGNLTIGKRNFTPVLKVALEQACNPRNIRSGFRKTGLFPLDRKAVDESKLVKGLHRPSDDSSTSHSSTGEDAPTASTSSSVYTDAANAVPDTVPRSTTVDSTCDVAEDPSTTTSSTVSSHRGPATITITTTTTVLTPWGSPASSSSATTTSPASSSPTIIATGSSSPTIAAASSSSATTTSPASSYPTIIATGSSSPTIAAASSSSATTTSPASSYPTIIATGSSSPTIAATAASPTTTIAAAASLTTTIAAAASLTTIAATAASPTTTIAAAASLTTIAATAASPTTTITAAASNTTATGQCPTCRRFPNPLVTAGVIPAALADILLPPHFDRPARGRGRRMPLPARVITSEEHAAFLAAKRAEEARKQQVRQDRANQRQIRQQQLAAQRAASAAARTAREAARQQREAARQEARQAREARQASARAAREAQEANRRDRQNQVLCALCGEGGVLLFLQCDGCSLWYHAECVDVGVVPEGAWCCGACHAAEAIMFEM